MSYMNDAQRVQSSPFSHPSVICMGLSRGTIQKYCLHVFLLCDCEVVSLLQMLSQHTRIFLCIQLCGHCLNVSRPCSCFAFFQTQEEPHPLGFWLTGSSSRFPPSIPSLGSTRPTALHFHCFPTLNTTSSTILPISFSLRKMEGIRRSHLFPLQLMSQFLAWIPILFLPCCPTELDPHTCLEQGFPLYRESLTSHLLGMSPAVVALLCLAWSVFLSIDHCRQYIARSKSPHTKTSRSLFAPPTLPSNYASFLQNNWIFVLFRVLYQERTDFV